MLPFFVLKDRRGIVFIREVFYLILLAASTGSLTIRNIRAQHVLKTQARLLVHANASVLQVIKLLYLKQKELPISYISIRFQNILGQ